MKYKHVLALSLKCTYACSAAEQRVVLDGHVLTSRGPGTALEFSLALVKLLFGESTQHDVAGPMVMIDQYTSI